MWQTPLDASDPQQRKGPQTGGFTMDTRSVLHSPQVRFFHFHMQSRPVYYITSHGLAAFSSYKTTNISLNVSLLLLLDSALVPRSQGCKIYHCMSFLARFTIQHLSIPNSCIITESHLFFLRPPTIRLSYVTGSISPNAATPFTSR